MSDLGISDWKVTILPLPKKFSRGTVLGFCGGTPVGLAEALRGKVVGTWWPGGKPELLALEGLPEVRAAYARGSAIPGSWQKKENGGAAAWRLIDGALQGVNLHDASLEKSWASAAGGSLIVGNGVPPRVPGQRTRNVGLVWRPGETALRITDPETGVSLLCTDGEAVGGSRDGRATLWSAPDFTPTDLSPQKSAGSEVAAMDSAHQYGAAFFGFRARAARWSGTAESYQDLTPDGFETARIAATAGDFQTGAVRQRDSTKNDTPAHENRAALWRGTDWFDLNSLLPKAYNASFAWGIEVVGSEVRVCGQAQRCEVSDPGGTHESHTIPTSHPVLWSGVLRH